MRNAQPRLAVYLDYLIWSVTAVVKPVLKEDHVNTFHWHKKTKNKNNCFTPTSGHEVQPVVIYLNCTETVSSPQLDLHRNCNIQVVNPFFFWFGEFKAQNLLPVWWFVF